MTVRQLLRQIDAHELGEWEAFFRLDPQGEARADLRAGIICSTVYAMAGKVSTGKLAPVDFMPFLDDKPATPPQSVEEQQMIARTVAAALGQRI